MKPKREQQEEHVMDFPAMVLAHDLINSLGEDYERRVMRIFDLIESVGDPLSSEEQAYVREFCGDIYAQFGEGHPAYIQITAALNALDRPEGGGDEVP